MTKSTIKAIKAGNQLIHQTIYNQAGSIEKAFLEYIMNSVDANASYIKINIFDNGYQYSISDNGNGFGDRSYTREEKEKCIDEVFGYLGFDHGSEEDNKRTYGKFGIGRAQLWAFSKNSWHTHDMTMDVDILNNGLNYEINQVKEFVDGCDIKGEFYEKVSLNEIGYIKKQLSLLSAYAPIEVYFNDELINKKIDDIKDVLNVNGVRVQIKPSAPSFMIYNQGVFVCEMPSYLFGFGGIICSEIGHPFQVNAARNDVLQSKCKLWKLVKNALNEKLNLTSKKEKITDEIRKSLLSRIAGGDYGYNEEYLSKPLIKMINNRYISLSTLASGNKTFTIGDNKSCPLSERIHHSDLALVLLSDFTDYVALTPKDFIKVLADVHDIYHYRHHNRESLIKELTKSYKELDTLKNAFDVNNYIIDKSKYTRKQKVFMEVINQASVQKPLSKYGRETRKILLGKSDTDDAWTDGYSYIALNEKLLEDISGSAGYILKIMHLIIHEYNHDDDNCDLHSLEFYENFHDECIDYSNSTYFALVYFLKSYTSKLIKNDLVIPRRLARSLNFFNDFVVEE